MNHIQDDDDKEENPSIKKTEENQILEAAPVKLPSSTARASSSVTAQSLFADDDESDLSLFRKK